MYCVHPLTNAHNTTLLSYISQGTLVSIAVFWTSSGSQATCMPCSLHIHHMIVDNPNLRGQRYLRPLSTQTAACFLESLCSTITLVREQRGFRRIPDTHQWTRQISAASKWLPRKVMADVRKDHVQNILRPRIRVSRRRGGKHRTP